MAQIIQLEQYRLLEIIGDDAEKYLQGQLTCDVTKLEIGQSSITAHCDPKGKVNLLLRLIRIDEQRFYALVRVDLLEKGLAELKKYAIFSKISFNLVDANLVAIAGENAEQMANEISAEVKIGVGENSASRFILINPTTALASNGTPADWDYLDIIQGYPILTAQNQGEFIPQALNLQCLEKAISFQKGCYIGQETIARAKYRGINKRGMYALVANSQAQPEIGAEIEMQLEQNWRKTGNILATIRQQDKLYLQVVMSNQIEQQQAFRLIQDQSPLEILPLSYSITE